MVIYLFNLVNESTSLVADCIENCDHDLPAHSEATAVISMLSRTKVNLNSINTFQRLDQHLIEDVYIKNHLF